MFGPTNQIAHACVQLAFKEGRLSDMRIPTYPHINYTTADGQASAGDTPVFRAWSGNFGILCLMKFTHHGLQIEIPDDWWTEAGMRGFVPAFTAYRVNHRLFKNVREVPIKDVGPVSRNSGVGIFNDSEEEGSAGNASCEFCAASGLTTPSLQWKSSRAKLDTGIDTNLFMVRTDSIVRWLRDSRVYRPSGLDPEH